MSSLSYANAILNIVPTNVPGGAIQLPSTGSAKITYSVTNNTNTTVGQFVIDPAYNIPANTLTLTLVNNQCTGFLEPNTSCTFSVLVQSTKAASATLMPRVCIFNGTNCSVPVAANRVNVTSGGTLTTTAYVVNYNNSTVSVCPVNQTNGSLGTCSVFHGSGTFNFPEGIVVNPQSTYAYILNSGDGTASVCTVDPASGQMGTCTSQFINGSQFAGAINAAGNILYTVDIDANGVWVCPLINNGSTLGTCSFFNNNGGFSSFVNAITLNASNTYAYVSASGGGTGNLVFICPINANGSLGTCTNSTHNLSFNSPAGISFSPDNSTAFISNTSNNVAVCSVGSSGSLGFCNIAHGNGTFDFNPDQAIALYMTSPTNIGYLPNGDNDTISVCPIINGNTIGTCTVNSDISFDSPVAVTINYHINR